MIVMWLAYAVAVACVLGLAALILERAFRWLGWAARVLWLGALVATLMLTGLAMRPTTRVAVGGPRPGIESGVIAAARLDVDVESSMAGVMANLSWLDRPLLIAWAGMSGVAFALLMGSAWRIRRKRMRWQRAVVDGVPVRETDGLGPAVVGLVRSEIVIPRWVRELDPADRQLVLRHEAEHVRARDPQLMFVVLLARAVMPWNPGILWLVRRFRAATEMDCDRRVLGTPCLPARYAALLIDIGARSRGRALSPAIVDGATDLERRIADILAGRGRPPRRAIALCTTCAVLLLLGAAWLPHPRVTVARAFDGATATAALGPVTGQLPTVTRVDMPATGLRTGRGGGGGMGGAGAIVGGRAMAGGRSPLIDNETLATHIAREHPQVFTEPGADPPVVALAFDASGQLLRTRRLTAAEPQVISLNEAMRRAFPEYAARRPVALSRRRGEVEVEGLPPRTLVVYHAVYESVKERE